VNSKVKPVNRVFFVLQTVVRITFSNKNQYCRWHQAWEVFATVYQVNFSFCLPILVQALRKAPPVW